ncbi:hypothetical protein ACFQ9V_01755 [Leifsonia sp. NPDC056665]|uniref:hypothetical protein n=1 Tax=Leifsonia sp. NPDC056665 TaxID=3345901 RepID=UPI0036A039A4
MDAEGDGPQEYGIYPEDDSIEENPETEGTNASRFAIAGALGATTLRGAPLDVVEPGMLEMFGFRDELQGAVDRLRGVDNILFGEGEFLQGTVRGGWQPREARHESWRRLNEGSVWHRLTLLAAGLCSSLERESVVAAVAVLNALPASLVIDLLGIDADDLLYPLPLSLSEPAVERVTWRSDAWAAESADQLSASADGDTRDVLRRLLLLAFERIRAALRSPDDVVRELAAVAWLRAIAVDDRVEQAGDDAETGANDEEAGGSVPPADVPDGAPPGTAPAAPARLSTLIHGTWAWQADWWYPGGDFHTHVLNGLRPALYDAGMPFSWSGELSGQHRAIAARRLKEWLTTATGGAGVGTVFAHSYGGEVAARAVNNGCPIPQLVLLSAPIHRHHRRALPLIPDVVDIRLRFDLVLTGALAKQRLRGPRVRNRIISKAFWQHGVTHDPALWHGEGLDAFVGP